MNVEIVLRGFLYGLPDRMAACEMRTPVGEHAQRRRLLSGGLLTSWVRVIEGVEPAARCSTCPPWPDTSRE